MKDLEFAALMCSRLCHDLISPAAALSNGLEVLEMDQDPEMREEADRLVKKSASQLAAKLQFARMAYGAATAHGKEIDLAEAREVADLLFEEGKARLHWDVPAGYAPKDVVRLLMNLCLLAHESVPRGHEVRVFLEQEGQTRRVGAEARGDIVVFPDKTVQCLQGALPETEVEPRTVQSWLTARLAAELNADLMIEKTKQSLDLIAKMPLESERDK